MTEKCVSLNVPFSLADAECPALSFSSGTSLRVKFLDWQEAFVEIEFNEVIGFKWNIEETEHRQIADDRVYEVVNSQWLNELRKIGEPVSAHKHYKLFFNACGVLDTLFSEMKVISPSK